MRVRRSVLTFSVLLLLAGCGAAGQEQRPAGPQRPNTTTATSTSAPAGATELRGKVTEGVESGCIVLQAEGKSYLLVGGAEGLKPGSEVHVKGHTEPDMMSFCQQGTPFVVDEVLKP